jgi:hypothetical protein
MRMSAALFSARLVRNVDHSQIRRHTDVECGMAFLVICDLVAPSKITCQYY